MRLRQGARSCLLDFTDEEIAAKIRDAVNHGWAIGVEFTDSPHIGSHLWELWDRPMFDLDDPETALAEIHACRRAHPECHIKVNAFDSAYGRQATALSFIVHRPD